MVTDSASRRTLLARRRQRSSQKSDSSQTVWYKVLERDESRALEDAQKTKISDNAFSYWYQRQKASST